MTRQTTAPDQLDDTSISHLWELNYDPLTIRLLEDLPIASGARCLDIGAGAGSMSYWLADRDRTGTVLAVDTDIGELDAGRAPNLTVRRLDISGTDLEPGMFDLVLARGVLATLPDPDDLLVRVADLLAPSGWLLVEDFYFLPGEDAPTETGRAMLAAYLGAFRTSGADTSWARRLPAGLAAAGLTSVGVNVRPLGPGMSVTDNRLMRRRLEMQGRGLVDGGLLADEHLDRFLAVLDTPAALDVTGLEISAWGRRPSGPRA